MKKFITGAVALVLAFNVLGTSVFAQVASPKEVINPGTGTRSKARPVYTGARVINAQVTAVGPGSLTVSKDGQSYTVNVTDATKIVRHYWGKSTLSEISVKDNVNVYGTWTEPSKTAINARLIRDLSIMKKHGVFFGTIISKDSASFVLQSVKRGNQAVSTGPNTKFTNRKQQAISYSDIQVGNKVRVTGMWDKNLNTVTEVTWVKDFSLPAKTPPPLK